MRRAARAIAIGLVLAGAAVASCSVLFPLDCFDGSCGGASVAADDGGTADVLDAFRRGRRRGCGRRSQRRRRRCRRRRRRRRCRRRRRRRSTRRRRSGVRRRKRADSPSTPDCNVLVPCTISNNLHAAFCGGSCALPKPNATITGRSAGVLLYVHRRRFLHQVLRARLPGREGGHGRPLRGSAHCVPLSFSEDVDSGGPVPRLLLELTTVLRRGRVRPSRPPAGESASLGRANT